MGTTGLQWLRLTTKKLQTNRIAFECRYNFSSTRPVARHNIKSRVQVLHTCPEGLWNPKKILSLRQSVYRQISESGTSSECEGAVRPRPRLSVHWDTNPVIWNMNTEHFWAVFRYYPRQIRVIKVQLYGILQLRKPFTLHVIGQNSPLNRRPQLWQWQVRVQNRLHSISRVLC
jgi:hypothetical protein